VTAVTSFASPTPLWAGLLAGYRDANGFSCLHFAAVAPGVEVLSLLLAAGADREALDDRLRTPLLLAASRGLFAHMSLLLNQCERRAGRWPGLAWPVRDRLAARVYVRSWNAAVPAANRGLKPRVC
jgi:hypothetical protein